MRKTEAIVISKINYNENKNIVNLYTLEFGFVSVLMYVSSSAKNKASQKIIFPLNIIEVELDIKESREIQILKNCSASEIILSNFFIDINKACICQFISELISKTIKEKTKNTEMYYFLKEFVILLNFSEKPSNYHLYFLSGYAKKLGFAISNNYCEAMPFFSFSDGMFIPVYKNSSESLDIKHGEIFSEILKLDKNTCEEFVINSYCKQLFLNSMLQYYRFHLNNNFELKSISIFNELFH